MNKLFGVICDIVRGFYLGQVIIMWPLIVLFVYASERAIGCNYTIKQANTYTWKTWNEVRTKKNL